MCLMAFALNAQEYVDLGLPSGTMWKDRNEVELYTYDAAMAEFGNSLPSYKQIEELIEKCEWEWNDKRNDGYTVTGPNGKSIFFPVIRKTRDCNGEWYENLLGGTVPGGSFWSSMKEGNGNAWTLRFTWNGKDVAESQRCNWIGVRLVKSK